MALSFCMALPRPLSPVFDPISLLVEDAVNNDAPELFNDFLDCLLKQQQQQQPLPDPVATSPVATSIERQHSSPNGFRKRRLTQKAAEAFADGSFHASSSPGNSMDLASGYNFLPHQSKAQKPYRSSSSSSVGSDDESRAPQRSSSHSSSHNGQGLSRKNRPQRCSICKETGHKSRTCKFAGTKVGVRPSSPDGTFDI